MNGKMLMGEEDKWAQREERGLSRCRKRTVGKWEGGER